jgi:TatD DNase family protein
MPLRLIDCHSHISFPAYDADREGVIARAAERGIGMVTVGTNIATSRAAVACADAHEGVWATIGLHPGHVHDGHEDPNEGAGSGHAEMFDVSAYRELAQSSKKVVAIGECGLDYYRVPEGIDVEKYKQSQRDVFRAHIDLAQSLSLPVMVHCREAHDDLCTILEEYVAKGAATRGNVHCFTGTSAEAARYVKLGWYLSFTGTITFPARKADLAAGIETAADVVRSVPLDRILVETDAPYLAPVPHRGKRNEPMYVEQVAEFVAQAKGVALDTVMAHTTQNYQKLFGI